LIELGAVLSDRGDVGLQLLLQLGGLALLLARGLEFLLALLDDLGGGGSRLLRLCGLLCSSRRKRLGCETCGKQYRKQSLRKQHGADRPHTAAGGVGVQVSVPR
jgi:hypothetical protein